MKYLRDTSTASRYYSHTKKKKKIFFHTLRQCIYSKFTMHISYIKSPPRKLFLFFYFFKKKFFYFFFYSMNSVHEQCPNSDPKQCTVTKLGWVHSAHTQNPGRTHTARAMPMSWALLCAQQACRAHVARSQRRSRACWACTCRDPPRL